MVLTQCSDIKVIVGTFLSQAFKFFKIGHEYFINNSRIDDVYEMEIYKRFFYVVTWNNSHRRIEVYINKCSIYQKMMHKWILNITGLGLVLLHQATMIMQISRIWKLHTFCMVCYALSVNRLMQSVHDLEKSWKC